MRDDGHSALAPALASLGLSTPRPVLVLIGGAANIAPAVETVLLRLFERLAPELDALGAALVDGATAFGVMALMGQARTNTAAGFPLIGVAAAGTIAHESLPPEARTVSMAGACAASAGARLDPHHSHFLLVPGAQWGDESAWISATADSLAASLPSLTLVAAGGRITGLDVSIALAARRALIVLAGSGGVCDLLARWWYDDTPIPDLALTPADRALIRIVDLAEAPACLPAMLVHALRT